MPPLPTSQDAQLPGTGDGTATPPLNSETNSPERTGTKTGSVLGNNPPATTNPDTVSQNNADAQTPDPTLATPSALAWEDITLPEGVEVQDDFKEKFLSVFNETDPKARAAGLLSLHNDVITSVAQGMDAEWNALQEQWSAEVKALPEFAGSNYEPSVAEIARLINKYGGKEVRDAFDLTGAGSHPAIVKMMYRIAKDINEEAPVSGTPPSDAPKNPKDILYPSMRSTKEA